MKPSGLSRRLRAAVPVALSSLIALSGCEGGGSAPAVSSSKAEATVTGTVVYKGKPVNEGEIRFNPANVARRDAPTAKAPIKDGKYSIKTLVGENSVSFSLPNLIKADPGLIYASSVYDVPGSGGTYDVDLSRK